MKRDPNFYGHVQAILKDQEKLSAGGSDEYRSQGSGNRGRGRGRGSKSMSLIRSQDLQTNSEMLPMPAIKNLTQQYFDFSEKSENEVSRGNKLMKLGQAGEIESQESEDKDEIQEEIDLALAGRM